MATPEQTQEAIDGKDGILSGVGNGRRPLVVVMSTVSAAVLEGMLPKLQALHVPLVDAPISGGSRGAEQGTLTVLTGGDERDIQAVKELFDCFASRQIHCGPIGSAQTMKIVNNIVGTSVTMIAGEAYRLAIEHGLDPAHVSEVLEACSGRNSWSKDPAGPQAAYAELVRDRSLYRRVTAIISKDLRLAEAMSTGLRGEYPTIRAMSALAGLLGDETFDNWRRIADARTLDEDSRRNPTDGSGPDSFANPKEAR